MRTPDAPQPPRAGNDRDRRLRVALGPHLQASEVRIIDVPAGNGIAAHKTFMVTTACKRETATTLVTRHRHRVRCPDCLAVIPDADGAQGERGN